MANSDSWFGVCGYIVMVKEELECIAREMTEEKKTPSTRVTIM